MSNSGIEVVGRSTQRSKTNSRTSIGKNYEPVKKSKQKKRKYKLKLLVLLLLAPFIYVAFNYLQVYNTAHTDQVDEETKADAILVLGAAQFNGTPSKVLEARLAHALDLYNKGVAPKIIVTGGGQPGDITTEATASANYLIKNGVDDSNILREVKGTSTFDSMRDASAFSKEQGIEEIVIVTDGFHMLRSRLIAQDFGLKVFTSPAKESPIKGKAQRSYFWSETGRVSWGGIIGFGRVSKDSTILKLVK